MLEKILVPDIGEYSNVEIIGIAVKAGDVISKEDELITLETDKATMEIPAPKSGTIKELLVKIGDKVSKGSEILMLDVGDGPSAAPVESAVTGPVGVVPGESRSAQGNTDGRAQGNTNERAQGPAPTVQDIILPNIGSDKPAAIIEIAIKAGDVINIDSTLITLESDKASMDVPSHLAGTVQEVLVKVGDKVATGAKIATLLVAIVGDGPRAVPGESGAVPGESGAAQGNTNGRAQGPAPTPDNNDRRTGQPDLRANPIERRSGHDRHEGEIYAGPGVRRFARELGVDLLKVDGTGRKSRIMQVDVQHYVKKTLQQVASGSVGGGLNISPAPEVDFKQFGEIEKQALTRIQKISGSFLHRNWVTIPHVTQFDEADITELEIFRQGQKELAEKQGLKLTPLVFLMKAAVAGLKQFPKFNSSLAANGEELILKKYYHIGVAVDTPNGLVVPVIRNVDQKGLFELAADLAAISKKARDGKLTGADMQGGCFTISSLGGIGGTAFTPIINAPEVAILGVSKSQTKPVYINNQLEPRLILPLSLSYDHRVVDGAEAVRFSSFMVNLLSDIRRLLL